MNLKQKLAAYNNLKAPQHIEKDIELLKRKAPEHAVLKSPFSKSDRQANEVLRALLDHVDSEKEIIDNRRKKENHLAEFGIVIDQIKEWIPALTKAENSNKVKLEAVKAITGLLEAIPENIRKHLPGHIEGFNFDLLVEDLYVEKLDPKDVAEKAGILTAKLHKTATSEERKQILDEIVELVKDFPEEAKTPMLNLPKSICEKMDKEESDHVIQEQKEELESKDEIIDEKDGEVSDLKDKLEDSESDKEELEEQLEESEEEKSKLISENSLLKADLASLSYPDKKKILFDLNLDGGLSDFKSDTITPVLQKKQDELLAASSGVQKKS